MGEVVKLDYPIEIGGKQVDKLDMRRPTVGDIQVVQRDDGTDFDRAVSMYARLTNQLPEDIAKLDYADYAKLDKLYEGFTKAAPAAGK